MTDLHQEIQCRIDYFKQLCRDRQFIDQETWHFYRGSVAALTTLLSYMERGGVLEEPLSNTDTTDTSANNFVLRSELAKKIEEGKEQKSRDIRKALEKFSEDYCSDKGYELGDLEAGEKFSRKRDSSRK